MRAELRCYGPDVGMLAMVLMKHGWVIAMSQQLDSQRGMIIGSHDDPDSFIGFGINDGTRIMAVIRDQIGDSGEDTYDIPVL